MHVDDNIHNYIVSLMVYFSQITPPTTTHDDGGAFSINNTSNTTTHKCNVQRNTCMYV